MKSWIAAFSSLSALKHLVLGTILFTLGSQIIPALWTEYEIDSTHQWRQSKVGHGSIASVEMKDSKTTTTRIATTSEPMGAIRWKSKGLDCIVRKTAMPTPKEPGNFTGLPEKYASIQWPPTPRGECGKDTLQRPWSLDEVKNPWMVFIVKSAPHHFAYRNMVRSSWGSISSYYNKTTTVVFLLGLPVGSNRTDLWQKAIEEENHHFGDILQCPVEDTYRNLPKKVIDSILWMVQRNFTGSFYTVTDDDCMMRIPNIYLFFEHLKVKEARDNIYCGFLYDRVNKPIRDRRNKWFVSTEQYSESRYPSFCHGGMYTMKRQMMKSIYCMSEVTNTTGFHLEDVLITGILREKLGQAGTNVKPVTTASGRNFDVMYYPWDGNPARTLWKMNHKWTAWNRTLLQYRQRKLMKSKPLPIVVKRTLVSKLNSFWKGEWLEIAKRSHKQNNNS